MKRAKKPKSVTDAQTSGEIMTMQQAADYLHCHYSTIYRLVRRGGFPVFRLGGDYRIRRADIDEWIGQQKPAAQKGPTTKEQ
jgi:excisionase family DNA binding protein